MDMKFVPRTHYFFSASKDKTVKYWDADKYENIMVLKVPQSFLYCISAFVFYRISVVLLSKKIIPSYYSPKPHILM